MDSVRVWGRFHAVYVEHGTEVWSVEFDNTVVDVGANFTLDTYLSGSGYTVTGPYMGLISSTSFTAISTGDTMTSHPGWLEAGSTNNPTYSGNRPTASWSSASARTKVLSSPASFSFTSSGTIVGGFLVFGSGASNAINNTGGTLYSAGFFATGNLTVANGGSLLITYTAGIL